MTDRAMVSVRSSRTHAMTSAAWRLLDAEIDRLLDAVRRGAHLLPTTDATDASEEGVVIRLPEADALRRLETLQALAEHAVVDDDPGVAVIGRRVTVRDPDGIEATYALVLPGDGDPTEGWISSDSPLGAAVTGHRAGDETLVVAPAGSWHARIVAVA